MYRYGLHPLPSSSSCLYLFFLLISVSQFQSQAFFFPSHSRKEVFRNTIGSTASRTTITTSAALPASKGSTGTAQSSSKTMENSPKNTKINIRWGIIGLGDVCQPIDSHGICRMLVRIVWVHLVHIYAFVGVLWHLDVQGDGAIVRILHVSSVFGWWV